MIIANAMDATVGKNSEAKALSWRRKRTEARDAMSKRANNLDILGDFIGGSLLAVAGALS